MSHNICPKSPGNKRARVCSVQKHFQQVLCLVPFLRPLSLTARAFLKIKELKNWKKYFCRTANLLVELMSAQTLQTLLQRVAETVDRIGATSNTSDVEKLVRRCSFCRIGGLNKKQVRKFSETLAQCYAYLDELPGGDLTAVQQQALLEELTSTLARKRCAFFNPCCFLLMRAVQQGAGQDVSASGCFAASNDRWDAWESDSDSTRQRFRRNGHLIFVWAMSWALFLRSCLCKKRGYRDLRDSKCEWGLRSTRAL